jgi:hypothetical protein
MVLTMSNMLVRDLKNKEHLLEIIENNPNAANVKVTYVISGWFVGGALDKIIKSFLEISQRQSVECEVSTRSWFGMYQKSSVVITGLNKNIRPVIEYMIYLEDK